MHNLAVALIETVVIFGSTFLLGFLFIVSRVGWKAALHSFKRKGRH